MEIKSVLQKQSFYARLGNLYVSGMSIRSNSVSLCASRDEADCTLQDREIKWLIDNVSGIQIIRINHTIEELECTDTLIIF